MEKTLDDELKSLTRERDIWREKYHAIYQATRQDPVFDPDNREHVERNRQFAVAEKACDRLEQEIVRLEIKIEEARAEGQQREMAETRKAQQEFVDGQKPVQRKDWWKSRGETPTEPAETPEPTP